MCTHISVIPNSIKKCISADFEKTPFEFFNLKSLPFKARLGWVIKLREQSLRENSRGPCINIPSIQGNRLVTVLHSFSPYLSKAVNLWRKVSATAINISKTFLKI